MFAQVSRLFKDAPELMEEFKDFLPEMLGPSAQREGLVGIMPHPSQSSGWDHPEPAPVEKAKPSRRRKRAADKEPVSSQSQAATKAANSRVRAAIILSCKRRLIRLDRPRRKPNSAITSPTLCPRHSSPRTKFLRHPNPHIIVIYTNNNILLMYMASICTHRRLCLH